MSFDPADGTYTYTPTQAARDAAAQNPGLTDTFTIRATDTFTASITTTNITVPIAPSATPPANPAPLIKSANPHTGEVRGPLAASGNGLSYTVISSPAKGTVTSHRRVTTFTHRLRRRGWPPT